MLNGMDGPDGRITCRTKKVGMGWTSFWTLVALALCGPLNAQVVVNEVCASNTNGYADNYGEFEDWFELYNPGAVAVDIGGWWLSNRAGNPMKWQVPAGTVIPAGARTLRRIGSKASSGRVLPRGSKAA